ncbi:MAG: Ppx/GppA family phosphatase [Bifidobacteriaceae bacterium]|jgi:exopolyphosphatase/guanosine-5'-triphosphate,3'-diphosphate pyrophosphatase|nr:Ppx/GppA family phosphatase [Bifidobacteriaceae bacterium]
MGTVRAAGIDCGTNSIRLLVADVDLATGEVRDVTRLLRLVRLGQGVDATGRLAPEALARTFAAVREYGGICRDLGVGPVRMVTTSATRDASNAGEFTDGVRAILGIDPEVVTGAEEAALSFSGAVGGAYGEAPYLVVDLGGGSTELVVGTDRVEAAHSMDVGCVRLTERRLRSDPPTAAELAAATADVDAALDMAATEVDLSRTGTVVGVAGTVTSVTAFALGLRVYDPARVDGTVLSPRRVMAACEALWSMSRAERLALGFLERRRADVIGAGAVVWSRVIRRVDDAVASTGRRLTSIITSEHDILDGVTLSAVRRKG